MSVSPRRLARGCRVELSRRFQALFCGAESVCGHSHTGEAAASTLLVADVAKSPKPRRAEQ